MGTLTTVTHLKTAASKTVQADATLLSQVSGAVEEIATSLQNHTDSTSNPHSVTAAQVKAVPLSGGTMTGLLTLSGAPTANLHAATKAYVDSTKPTVVTATLSTSGWSSSTQTVTVSGVSATETAQLIQPVPAIASQSAYYDAGILCTGQADNALTFTCDTVPTAALTVYVVITAL